MTGQKEQIQKELSPKAQKSSKKVLFIGNNSCDLKM